MQPKPSVRPDDRRQYERIPARIAVRFAGRPDAARAFRAFSLNFSVGGICLRTDRVYEIGAPMALTLAIDGSEHQLTGTVAWVRKGYIGIRFDIEMDESRAKIARIMELVRQQ